MTFFYDLNKRLDGIRATPETTHKQLNERDMGKHNNATTGFKALAAKTNDKIAGAQFQKMKKAGQLEEGHCSACDCSPCECNSMEESAFQAAIGKKKYGDEGMQALQKAGRNHSSDKTMDAIRNRFNKYDESQGMTDEGNAFAKAVVDAKRDGVQPGEKIRVDGKEYPVKEAAKWRDPKFKDKLYTQEPRDYEQYDYGDDDYYNPKPANYPGKKNLKGGSEFDHNDPLQKGQGIGRSGIKHNILDRGPRKGLPSRDQITSLKGSIKSAKGTHAQPNLPEAGAPMTDKQKSFAALAPPRDKITFADKIAGAKKEVDEMLGDVAAEAMKKALGGGIGRSAEMEEKEDNSPFTAHKRPRTDQPKVGSVEHGALHDIEHTATGRKVTRRVDPNTGHSVGADDDTPHTGEKRGKGRPKKAGGPNQERVTAKSRKTDRTAHGQEGFKKDKKVKESDEYGDEGDMAKDDLRSIAKAAAELNSLLNDHDDLPEWVQSKITKALDYINTSNQYMDQEKSDDDTSDDVMGGDEELDEKATSKAQRRAAAIAMHAPKGKLQGASKEMSKMPKKELGKFAGTKEKGLPNKKEKTQETTTSGSVATSTAAPKAGKGGVQFGKGIYESLDRQLKQQLNEEMSINMSIGTDGRKSITVTASDEDADQLAQILNLAGLQGHGHDHGAEACPTCGEAPCGCAEVVDENAPDYPQNMGQTSNTNFMTKTNAGGLNKEKYTGQSTLTGGGIPNLDASRQHAYENVELERSLFKLYQEVKSK